MSNKSKNVFRRWHKAASTYDEFLHQRIHSSLALQIASMPAESLYRLPSAGLITWNPALVAAGMIDCPAIQVWVLGDDDSDLEEARAEWPLFEAAPFAGLDQFLQFEHDFLKLDEGLEVTWEGLSHEERVVAAVSFLSLIKPIDWLRHDAVISEDRTAARGAH